MAHFRRVVRPAAFGRQPPAAASDERTAGTPNQAPVHASGSRPGNLHGGPGTWPGATAVASADALATRGRAV